MIKKSNTFYKDWKECLKVESTKPLFSGLFDKDLRTEILRLKSRLGKLDNKLYQFSKSRSNKFEKVGKSGFVNRSAVKLAEINTIFGIVPSGEFKFLDLCGGPGGFSEYLLGAGSCSGFGFTLKGELDYTVIDDRFKRLYGDGTGNIYNIENINSIEIEVGKVELCVADGGFNVHGDETYQEQHTTRLILCQILAMLKCLQKQGSFVVKLFEFHTPIMTELIYLLYLQFDKITVFKGCASRPGNSERYLVCKGFIGDSDELVKYLNSVVEKYWELGNNEAISSHSNSETFEKFEDLIINSKKSINHIIDFDIVLKNTTFVQELKIVNLKF